VRLVILHLNSNSRRQAPSSQRHTKKRPVRDTCLTKVRPSVSLHLSIPQTTIFKETTQTLSTTFLRSRARSYPLPTPSSIYFPPLGGHSTSLCTQLSSDSTGYRTHTVPSIPTRASAELRYQEVLLIHRTLYRVINKKLYNI
jgi:hypothetical protein